MAEEVTSASVDRNSEEYNQMMVRHQEKFARFYLFPKVVDAEGKFIPCVIGLLLLIAGYLHLHSYLLDLTGR